MIGIDWGTSSFRAYRLAADGSIAEKRAASLGILAVQNGKFAEALERQVGDWLDDGEGPVIMSGMIGSRQGWKEAPYATCPAGAKEIAAGMVEVHWGDGRRAWIAPGLRCMDAQGIPDVMRGEEVQILGALDQLARLSSWICLPGTHSKWVHVKGGRIIEFATHMTGEMFAVLKAHSILGRMMGDEPKVDAVAFEQGVLRAREPGGLLHHLFGVRTRGLLGELRNEQSAAYLSGLLIGHELKAVARLESASVYLLGAPDLVSLYAGALKSYGVDAAILDPDAVVGGLHNLAQQLTGD